jgi:hypothetical protein
MLVPFLVRVRVEVEVEVSGPDGVVVTTYPLHASRLLMSFLIFHNSTFWSRESSNNAALIALIQSI